MMSNDANGDGKLSREELPGRFAERMFDANDGNGDGFLDSAELKAAAAGFLEQRGNRPDRAGAPGQVRPGGPADAIDRPGPARGVGPEGAPLDFEGGMKQAGRALRSLRRSPFDAGSREKDLESIGLIQQGLMAAKLHLRTVPMAEQAEARFGDDEAAYHATFRMTLLQALMESLELEMAVTEGDSQAAKDSLAHLLENRKEGHRQFEPEDEDDAAEHDEAAPARIQPGRIRPSGRD